MMRHVTSVGPSCGHVIFRYFLIALLLSILCVFRKGFIFSLVNALDTLNIL